jgi:hypothetical protein
MAITYEKIKKQAELARASIRKLTSTHPGLFPEYQRLRNAETDLRKAELAYAEAKAAWDALRD